MKKLYLKFKDEMVKRKITYEDLGKITGKQKGTLTYYLNYGREMPFIMFLQIIEELLPEQYREMTLEYITYLKKPVNLHEVYEYAWNNCDKELLLLAYKKAKTLSGLKIYTKIQRLIFERSERLISKKEFIQLVECIEVPKTESKETKLTSIVLLYAQLLAAYDNNAYLYTKTIAMKLLKELGYFKSSYVKDSMKLKIQESLLNMHMTRGDKEDFTTLLESLLSATHFYQFKRTYSHINVIAAEFYCLTDYSKSKAFIQEAYSVNINHSSESIRVMRATSDFIKVLNNDFEVLYLEDDAEKAFYYIKVGKISEGIALLKEIGFESSPFRLYYMGIATDNIEYHYKSLELFAKMNHIHYMQLPLDEIKSYNANCKKIK